MNNLCLIGEKVVKSNGEILSVISQDFSDGLKIILNDGKLGYYINISIPNAIFRFLNEKVQNQVEELITLENIKEQKKVEGLTNLEKNNDKEKKCKKELLAKLGRFGFDGFLHTTELDNLRNIIASEYLFSRDKIKNFIDRANSDVIIHTPKEILSYCRFYYQYITPTNYRANYKNPVTIVFNKELIYEESVIFCEGNAASKYSFKTTRAEKALDFEWGAIFERGCNSYSDYYDKEKNNVEYITRIRNSEFLVKDKVHISNISKVYFKTEEDYYKAKTFSPQWLSSKYLVDRGKFPND